MISLFLLGPTEFIYSFLFMALTLNFAAMWALYEKANKPGWAALIPIYNIIIFVEIIRKPWWWTILMLIPFLNVVWIIWAWNLMVKCFGKNEDFTFGVILAGIIFIPILGLGDSNYTEPIRELY